MEETSHGYASRQFLPAKVRDQFSHDLLQSYSVQRVFGTGHDVNGGND